MKTLIVVVISWPNYIYEVRFQMRFSFCLDMVHITIFMVDQTRHSSEI